MHKHASHYAYIGAVTISIAYIYTIIQECHSFSHILLYCPWAVNGSIINTCVHLCDLLEAF